MRRVIVLVFYMLSFAGIIKAQNYTATIVADTKVVSEGSRVLAYLGKDVTRPITGNVVKIDRNISNSTTKPNYTFTRIVISWPPIVADDHSEGQDYYSSVIYEHPKNVKVDTIPGRLVLNLKKVEDLNFNVVSNDTRTGGALVEDKSVKAGDEERLLSPRIDGENHYRYDENLLSLPAVINSGNTSLTNVIGTSRFIPAQIPHNINSEIPGGRVNAIFSGNVYGDHGTKILIPAGSIIEGSYESLKSGQRRLNILFNKITTPKGDVIAMSGGGGVLARAYDPSGELGMQGTINYDYVNRLLLPYLIQTASGATNQLITNELAKSNITLNSTNTTINQSDQASSLTTKATNDLLELLNAKDPVIDIPAGAKLLVVFTRNLVFRENQDSIRKNGYDISNWKK